MEAKLCNYPFANAVVQGSRHLQVVGEPASLECRYLKAIIHLELLQAMLDKQNQQVSIWKFVGLLRLMEIWLRQFGY